MLTGVLFVFFGFFGFLTIALWAIATSSGVSRGGRLVAAVFVKAVLLCYLALALSSLWFAWFLIGGGGRAEGTGGAWAIFFFLPFGISNAIAAVFLLYQSPGFDAAKRKVATGAGFLGLALAKSLVGVVALACLVVGGVTAAEYVHHWWATADQRATAKLPHGNVPFDSADFDASGAYFVTRSRGLHGSTVWSTRSPDVVLRTGDLDARLVTFDAAPSGKSHWLAETQWNPVSRMKVLQLRDLDSSGRTTSLPVGEDIVDFFASPGSREEILVLTPQSWQLWSIAKRERVGNIPRETWELLLQRELPPNAIPGLYTPRRLHPNKGSEASYQAAIAADGSKVALSVGDLDFLIVGPDRDPDAAVRVRAADIAGARKPRFVGSLFSADAKYLFVGHEWGMAVVDTESRSVVKSLELADPCTRLDQAFMRPRAVSPDGKRLLVETDLKMVCVIAVPTFEFERQISHAGFEPVPGRTWWERLLGRGRDYFPPGETRDALAISADASRVAISAPYINRTFVWEAATGQLIRELCPFVCHEDGRDAPRAMALSPDGSVLLISIDDVGHAAWDTASGRQVFALTRPSSMPAQVRGGR